MTPEEFVEAVVDAYCNSRLLGRPHEKLRRGESRSVASEMEDLLAYYLVTRIPLIEKIFINQPLTVKDQPRFKPDLVICQRSQICALVDVKIDLGYKRDQFPSTMRQADMRIAQLRGLHCSYLVKNGSKAERNSLPVAENARYLFAIISNQNVSPKLFGGFEEVAASLKKKNTTLHVLTRDFHPNQPCHSKETVLNRIKICHDAFEAMENEIKSLLSAAKD